MFDGGRNNCKLKWLSYYLNWYLKLSIFLQKGWYKPYYVGIIKQRISKRNPYKNVLSSVFSTNQRWKH